MVKTFGMFSTETRRCCLGHCRLSSEVHLSTRDPETNPASLRLISWMVGRWNFHKWGQFWPILRGKLAVSFRECMLQQTSCQNYVYTQTSHHNRWVTQLLLSLSEPTSFKRGFTKKPPCFFFRPKRRSSSGNRPEREDVDLWWGKRSASAAFQYRWDPSLEAC